MQSLIMIELVAYKKIQGRAFPEQGLQVGLLAIGQPLVGKGGGRDGGMVVCQWHSVTSGVKLETTSLL